MSHPKVKITHARDIDVQSDLGELHVLTYAEEGFSPLDIHARRYGIDSDQVRAFADAVNDRLGWCPKKWCKSLVAARREG